MSPAKRGSSEPFFSWAGKCILAVCGRVTWLTGSPLLERIWRRPLWGLIYCCLRIFAREKTLTQLSNTLFLIGNSKKKSKAQTIQNTNLNTAQMSLAIRGSSELFLRSGQVYAGCVGRLYLKNGLTLAGGDVRQAALRPDLLLLANLCPRQNDDSTW